MFCNTKFIANLFLYAALEWNINRQEKAMEICQEAIDRSIQAESFRGLLPLLKQRLFFEKQLKWNQEEWDEQEKTIGMIDELFAEIITLLWKRDRKSTRLNSSHSGESRMPSSA